MKNILLLTALFSLNLSLADCIFQGPKNISMMVSTAEKSTIFYDNKGISKSAATIDVSQCKDFFPDKFLMIGMGTVQDELLNETSAISYNGNLKTDKCRLINTEFKALNPSEQKNIFDKKYFFMKNCLELKIINQSTSKLIIPNNQTNCTITKENENSITMSGGLCFLKPFPNSRYIITPTIKKECQDINYLSSQGIEPQDIDVSMNYFAAGDATGNSTDLKTIQSYSLRLSIESLKSHFGHSEDFGGRYPKWPAVWSYPEVELGKFTLKKTGRKKIGIHLPLAVNHISDKRCLDNICYPLSNYALPLAAEVKFYKIVNGQKNLIASWYQGDVIKANWQGLMVGRDFQISESLVEIGQTYNIELLFRNPKFDFDYMTSKWTSSFAAFENLDTDYKGNEIPSINPITEEIEVPELATIPSFGGNLEEGHKSFKQLANYINYKTWPPYYTHYCSHSNSSCSKVDEQIHLKISSSFSVTNLDSKNGEFEITNIKTTRLSKMLPKLEVESDELPQVVCGKDNI